MNRESKVQRANELLKTIKDAEAELDALFGDATEKPKRKWTRRSTNGTTEPSTPTLP